MGDRQYKPGREKTVGYGWVGKWRNGDIGWRLPKHLSYPPNMPDIDNVLRGKTLYHCRITIEVLHARNGRPITKIPR